MFKRTSVGVIVIATALIFSISSTNAAKPAHAGPNREPFDLIAPPQEYNTGANRPWLDQTCYDDDHGVSFHAEGWLNGTWTFVSPLPMCATQDHHIKVIAQWKSRDDATLSIVDHNGTSLPIRYDDDDTFRWFNGPVDTARGCNTDVVPNGYLYVVRSEQIRAHVVWTVTTTELTELALSGGIFETPSPTPTGGEGSWDHCLFPPPGGLNPQDPFG